MSASRSLPTSSVPLSLVPLWTHTSMPWSLQQPILLLLPNLLLIAMNIDNMVLLRFSIVHLPQILLDGSLTMSASYLSLPSQELPPSHHSPMLFIIQWGGGDQDENEWMPETDGVNLKCVMCADSTDFMHTYSHSCMEVFNVLSIEVARVTLIVHHSTLMAITWHGSVNYGCPHSVLVTMVLAD